jgi:hypothetical protein
MDTVGKVTKGKTDHSFTSSAEVRRMDQYLHFPTPSTWYLAQEHVTLLLLVLELLTALLN